MGYFRLVLILGLGLIVWAWDLVDGPPPSFPTSGHEVTDSYRELRGGALEVRPERSTDAAEEPQSVLMEVGATEGVATLKVDRDGRVSVYTSKGGSRSAPRTAEISAAAESFRREAARAAHWMHPTTEYPLPAHDRVRFYIVGADGVRTAEAAFGALYNGGHGLSVVFRSGTDLVMALHEED